MALITYLALTRWRSRTPHALSRDLGLDETAITNTLKHFRDCFVRAEWNVAIGEDKKQYPYTLHARYAKRRPEAADSDRESNQDGTGEELSADALRALLDFVTERARAEREDRQQRISQIVLIVGVIIAAVASVISAIIHSGGS